MSQYRVSQVQQFAYYSRNSTPTDFGTPYLRKRAGYYPYADFVRAASKDTIVRNHCWFLDQLVCTTYAFVWRCSLTNVWVGLYRRLSGGEYEWSDSNLSPAYASAGSSVFFFIARCTTVQSAVLRSHVVCPSVCLSVTLVDHDNIGWKSWKLIALTISPTSLLFVAQWSSTNSQGTWRNFGEKMAVYTVCLLLSPHRAVIFATARLSCFNSHCCRGRVGFDLSFVIYWMTSASKFGRVRELASCVWPVSASLTSASSTSYHPGPWCHQIICEELQRMNSPVSCVTSCALAHCNQYTWPWIQIV